MASNKYWTKWQLRLHPGPPSEDKLGTRWRRLSGAGTGGRMGDLPKEVEIQEEGPREGFQIEPGPIASADKIRLIEALAQTGLHHIQVCSFVNPRLVPGWADADDVVAGFRPAPGVHYVGLWF